MRQTWLLLGAAPLMPVHHSQSLIQKCAPLSMGTAPETDLLAWRGRSGLSIRNASPPVIRCRSFDSERFNAVLLTPQPCSPNLSPHGPLSGQDWSNHLVRSDRLSRFPGHRCDTVGLLRKNSCGSGFAAVLNETTFEVVSLANQKHHPSADGDKKLKQSLIWKKILQPLCVPVVLTPTWLRSQHSQVIDNGSGMCKAGCKSISALR
jgi:hypothetical protein